MILVTSNPSKRSEYLRYAIPGLDIIDGPDIREVAGTPDEIIIHKALEAGEGRIVEDAIIRLDKEPMIDVRWKIDALRNGEYPLGAEIIWEVRLGVLQEGIIKLFYGEIVGELCRCLEDGFGVDPVIYLPSEKLTLATMDRMGIKDRVSPRRAAIQSLIDDKPYLVVNKNDVQPWAGEYQHD